MTVRVAFAFSVLLLGFTSLAVRVAAQPAQTPPGAAAPSASPLPSAAAAPTPSGSAAPGPVAPTPDNRAPSTPGYTPPASPTAPNGAPQPAPAPPPAQVPATVPIVPAYPALPPGGAPMAPAPAPPPWVPPPPPTPQAPDMRRDDAHVDRVVVMPTGETQPAGTLTFSSYDIVGLQAGWAMSDTTQLTLTATPPLGPDGIFPLDVTLKTVVLRAPRVRIAALGSASGIIASQQGNALVGRAGAVVQLCFDEACRSSVSTGSTILLAGPAMLVANGFGAIWRLTDVFALLLEVDSLIPVGREAGNYYGMAVGPGIRFSGKRWGIDFALYRGLGSGSSSAVPLLVGTYRFLP